MSYDWRAQARASSPWGEFGRTLRAELDANVPSVHFDATIEAEVDAKVAKLAAIAVPVYRNRLNKDWLYRIEPGKEKTQTKSLTTNEWTNSTIDAEVFQRLIELGDYVLIEDSQ